MPEHRPQRRARVQTWVKGELTAAQFDALQQVARSQGRPFVPDSPSPFMDFSYT